MTLAAVEARVTAACARARRAREDVTLLAVSKGQPAAAIAEAYSLGQRDFGENYAQELRDKARELSTLKDIRWHFIGPLQTNKVKYVVGTAGMLHTLERVEVAGALHARLTVGKRTLDVLLEINVGAEDSKHGLTPDAAAGFVDALKAFPTLRAVGLMCIPPAVDDPEGARPMFRTLRALAQSLGLKELSMGMSHDFEVAIEEGATLIRVGTAIFGERQQKQKA